MFMAAHVAGSGQSFYDNKREIKKNRVEQLL